MVNLIKKYYCTNFGNCETANGKTLVEIADGEELICPKCKKRMLVPAKMGPNKLVYIIVGVVILMLIGFGAYIFFSGDNNKTESLTITIDPSTTIIKVEESAQLRVIVGPEDTSVKPKLKWISSDENVALVNSEGLVTGKAEGIASISVMDEKNDKIMAFMSVNVLPMEEETPLSVSVESLALNLTSLTLKVNQSEEVTVIVSPDNATNRDVVWSSGDESVATVNNGVISAIKAGTTVIIAKSVDNSNKSAECKVTVQASASSPLSSPVYSFGRYEGKLVNGIPDGQGTMYYSCRVQIAKHSRNTYYAEAGDTFVGTWGNGDIVNGNLYDRNNNQKAAILAGKRPNPYDLKQDKCE